MIQDPVADWRELSALYEQADALDDQALAALLLKLQTQGNRMLPQLRRMLDARARVAAGAFLNVLPAIDTSENDLSSGWSEGSRIGAYRLVRHLGVGGTAEVWLAQRVDGAFERRVAIKLPFYQPTRLQRENFVDRFDRERAIVASLAHPNIAGLHDAGVTLSGQPWLALEYVEGEPIAAWCDANRLTIKDRVRLFRQVLLAIEYAHANLVLHRDVKPANILVTKSGAAKLLDFGIAKLLAPEGGSAEDTEVTQQLGRMLTLQYASPEQISGKPLTTASDVYSLGVVLYELLCGERPHGATAKSAIEMLNAALQVDPKLPSKQLLAREVAAARSIRPEELRKAIGADLDAVVLKALRKTSEDRYRSVDALRLDLERWLDGRPVGVRIPSAAELAARFLRRHPFGVGLGSVAIVALLCATAVVAWSSLATKRESERAIAAKDFLLNVLREGDPDRTKGSDLKVADILLNGRQRAAESLKSQPALRAELLVAIAEVQESLGETDEAEKTFAEASDVYESVGLRREAALARISEAEQVIYLGDFERAALVLGAAQTAAKGMTSDAAAQARLYDAKGEVSWYTAHFEEAELSFQTALKYALVAYPADDGRIIDILTSLASVQSSLKRFSSAEMNIADAAARSARISATIPGYSLATERIWAQIEVAEGDMIGATRRLQSASAHCDAIVGNQSQICPSLRVRLTLQLLRLGRADEALRLVPTMRASLASTRSPLRVAEGQMAIARVLVANGQLRQDDEIRSQLIRFGESGEQVRQADELKCVALMTIAEIALREDRPSEAASWMKIVAERRKTIDPTQLSPDFVARQWLLTGLANGDPGLGLSQLQLAQQESAKVWGPEHPWTVLLSINVAESMRSLGDRKGADAIVRHALPVLTQTLGPDAPAVRDARVLEQLLASEQASQTKSNRRVVFFN